MGVRKAEHEDKNQKWLSGTHVGKLATSHLPSRGTLTLTRGQKTEMATWPTCGQSGYITPVVLGVPNGEQGDRKAGMATLPTFGERGYISRPLTGVPNAQREDKKHIWLPGPHVGKMATSPPPSRWVPNAQHGDKKQKWLPSPHMGKVAKSPLPSRGSPKLSAWTTIRNGYLPHTWAT